MKTGFNRYLFIEAQQCAGGFSIKNLIATAFVLPACCLQHLTHEYAHVFAGLLLGEKVERIQWLTYNGGTKVFFRNEPDFESENVDKKWVFITSAGVIATSFLGYLFATLYLVASNGWIKTGLVFFALVFLLVDAVYFLLGSVFNFGDIVGIREVMKIPKYPLINPPHKAKE